jgi:APA family basic amino acid/polyamine antiporter
VKEPHKTLPRALTLGVTAVIGLYLLVNLAYLAVLPIQGSAEGADALSRGIANAKDDRVATAVLEQAGSKWGFDAAWGARAMAICVMVSTFGCVNGMILMGARLYYVMARDGLFFRPAGSLNGAGVPAASLLMQAGWAVLLVFTGAYGELLDYVMFAAVLFYALATVGLVVLRIREPTAPRPVRVPLYPLAPILYLLCCLAFMAAVLVTKPQYTWPGLAVVLLGLPIFGLWDLSRIRRRVR